MINNIDEVIEYLNDGLVLINEKGMKFVKRKDNIQYFYNGSAFKLKIEDFKDLFKDDKFDIYEDNDVIIDDQKDEDYYRYYKK